MESALLIGDKMEILLQLVYVLMIIVKTSSDIATILWTVLCFNGNPNYDWDFVVITGVMARQSDIRIIKIYALRPTINCIYLFHLYQS